MKTETLITFYTPTYRRPKLLAACLESVKAQTLAAWEHVVIRDEIGVGIDGMYRNIPQNLDKLHGCYVYVLQDDDRLADIGAVEALERFARERDYPPVIICKNVKDGRLLPGRWGQEPQLGYIDLGSYIIRADIFKANATSFGARYEGDFDFISALWRQQIPFAWWDFIFAEAMQVGRGKPEYA